jgi:hypothetical protein
MAPLLLVGVLWVRRYVDGWASWWLWVWLAIFPLGGALTNDGVPHAPRTLAGLLVLCIFSAIGLFALLDFARLFRSGVAQQRYRHALWLIVVLAAGSSVGTFTRFYYLRYPIQTAADWESGNAQLFARVRARQNGYLRACFNGINYFHVDTLVRFYLAGSPLRTFENNEPDCGAAGTLLVTTAPAALPGFTLLDSVQRVDGRLYAVIEGYPLPAAH